MRDLEYGCDRIVAERTWFLPKSVLCNDHVEINE
jgi:hypothetical protein